MLYVATVHHGSPRWIEIQARQLRQHIPVPFQTWSSLQGIDKSYGAHFDRVIDQAGKHAGKLNQLAMEIAAEAGDDDLLMFLDGDAFPIADPMPLINQGLAKAPLIAVRRAENLGDRQPHPLFCVTAVATWRALHGDWSEGHRWRDSNGRLVTDVGGNLLRALELTSTSWAQVLRSNRDSVDPLFFAIYGDVIYHHGAGFRKGAFRAQYATRPRLLRVPPIPLIGEVVRMINRTQTFVWRLKTRGPQIVQSKRIYDRIHREDEGWLAELGWTQKHSTKEEGPPGNTELLP